MIELFTNIAIVVAGFAALFFVVGYGFAAPWWRSDTGRHFFSFGVLILAILALVNATTFLGTEWTGRPIVRLVLYVTIAFILIWRNRIFVSAQLRRSLDSGSEDGNGPQSLLGEKRYVGSGEGSSE